MLSKLLRERWEQPPNSTDFKEHGQGNQGRVPSQHSPTCERREQPGCHRAGHGARAFGKGGSRGRARSRQVSTPVHHLAGCLGALSINFLSRKLIFSSCRKQKEEQCVKAEENGS